MKGYRVQDGCWNCRKSLSFPFVNAPHSPLVYYCDAVFVDCDDERERETEPEPRLPQGICDAWEEA